MGQIHQLNERVINQIAAGEVVERPVAVVKELVENSLDAGASRVEVEFRDGGKSLIRVTDDGCGMSREDAVLALRRHATSKIREFSDLWSVSSFGFRGEALPSIASVSRFRLRTRPMGQAQGSEVLVENGRMREPGDCGMPTGTTVEVSQLFDSVPARRKFLKTDRTEAAHIIRVCRLLALAHVDVAFTLIEDGRVLFQSPPAPDMQYRVREIFGSQFAEILMPIDCEEGELHLGGLIGRPMVGGRATRADMNTFVNRRPVESRTLQYALIESYHTYIPKGRYPAAFLFLEMPPRGLDVNVHPAKREVRFRDEGSLRRFVMEGVIGQLRQNSQNRLKKMEPVAGIGAVEAAVPVVGVKPPNDPPGGVSGSALVAGDLAETPGEVPNGTRDAPAPRVDPVGESGLLPGWRYLGVSQGRYLIFDTNQGIVLMHRRAACQRILHERILRSVKQRGAVTQDLMFCPMLEMDPMGARVVEDLGEKFVGWGFGIEPFGRNLFRLRGIPDWLEPEEAEAFVRDFVAVIAERGWKSRDEDHLQEQVAGIAARRMSMRADLSSGMGPMELAIELLRCEVPLQDPGGRPTLIELSHTDLARRFGV